jgi:hypothetical protein
LRDSAGQVRRSERLLDVVEVHDCVSLAQQGGYSFADFFTVSGHSHSWRRKPRSDNGNTFRQQGLSGALTWCRETKQRRGRQRPPLDGC